MKSIKSILLPVLALGVLTACTDEEVSVVEEVPEVQVEEKTESEKLAEEKTEDEKKLDEEEKAAEKKRIEEEKLAEEKVEKEEQEKIEAEKNTQAKASQEENMLEQVFKENLGHTTTVKFIPESKTFEFTPVANTSASEMILQCLSSRDTETWEGIADVYKELDDIVFNTLGPDYSIAVVNPLNHDQYALMWENGGLMIDLMYEIDLTE